jgi:hypothetical protein
LPDDFQLAVAFGHALPVTALELELAGNFTEDVVQPGGVGMLGVAGHDAAAPSSNGAGAVRMLSPWMVRWKRSILLPLYE